MPRTATISRTQCPDREQISEAYVLGRLAPEEMAAFDAHTARCRRCADALAETFEFVEAFQHAARKRPAARKHRANVATIAARTAKSR